MARQDTYNQTVGIIVDMDDMVDILPVDDVPFQQWVPNGPPADSTKVEWLSEELTGQVVTVASTSATASTTVVVETGDGALLRPGDVLAFDAGVQVVVDSVATDTVTLSIRPFADTTDEQLVAGDELTIIGQYRDEGGDPEEPRFTDRGSDYNYTQADQEAVRASRTTQQTKRYGMGNPFTHEQMKKFREIAIRHERRLLLGRRKQGTGGDAKKRSMGGALFYATENAVSGTKATLATKTNELLRNCWNAGGAPKDLWVSADAKELYDALNADRLLTSPSDQTYQNVITRFKSSFGDVAIRFSRYIPKQKVVAVDQPFAKHRTMQGYAFEPLAKTGDADNGQIICEKSFELKNPKAHGVLTITDL